MCGAAGLAGVLSYVSSEVLFWVVSLPLGVLAYHQSTGEWLDLSTADGQTKVSRPCAMTCLRHLLEGFVKGALADRSPTMLDARLLASVPVSWRSLVWRCL